MLVTDQQPFLHLNGCNHARSFQAVLDCLSSGVFLLDRSARVRWYNRSAHQIAAAGDGLVLRKDRLRAEWAGDNRRLAAALAKTAPATIRIARPSGRPGYLVHAHHLEPAGPSGQIIALLVNAPEHVQIPRETLMDAYRLTPAEARVALAVVHGDCLADAAGRLRVSINTVKSTLQRVFAKTETRTQAQLVRLLVTTS